MGGPRRPCLPTILSSFAPKKWDLLRGRGVVLVRCRSTRSPYLVSSCQLALNTLFVSPSVGRGGGRRVFLPAGHLRHPGHLPDTSVPSVSMMSDVNTGLTGQEEIQSDQILGRVDFSTLEYADVFTRLQIVPSGLKQKFGLGFFLTEKTVCNQNFSNQRPLCLNLNHNQSKTISSATYYGCHMIWWEILKNS